jgi:DNA-binding CsgD family transcriptional regulator/tetratricopeptide (TPR) repeat protein
MTGVGRMLGRDDQLCALMDAIDGAAPLVLVVGDAGIGKSRLVAAAVETAREQGVVALVGGCVPLSGKLPLLPFVEALDGMSDTVAEAMLHRMPPAQRHSVIALMPKRGIEASVDGANARRAVGEPGAWQRERLVLAVAALLSPPVRTLPTLVVVEDLHWADTFTLDLLTYLVAGTHTGATFVVTLRTDQRPTPPAVLEAVAELQRLEAVVTVELGPLPANLVAQQVEALLGQESSPQLIDQLVELGGGNPFFTEQLCSHAATGGSPGSRRAAQALPPQLAGFLHSRIERLTERARRALLLLGVAGMPLSARELATAAALTEQEAAEAVRELSAAALLAPTRSAHVAPRHALLSAAVVEAADPFTLAWAHAQMGKLLDDTEDPTSAVASAGHWAAAGRERDELHATLVAGPVAEALADFTTAATLWQRAYTLAQRHPEQAATEGFPAVAVAVSALDAFGQAGLIEEGIALAEDVFDRYAPFEETYLGGTLRYWVGHFLELHDRAAGTAVLTDAVRVLSGCGPSVSLSRCLSRLARVEEQSSRPDLAASLAERGLLVAQSCGSAYAEVVATSALGQALLASGRVDEALERTATLAARPDVAADAPARCRLAVFESDLLLITGQLEQARAAAQAAYDLLLREGYGKTFGATILRNTIGEIELELGQSARVRKLVDPVTRGRVPTESTTGDHLLRALVDLNEGEVQQAKQRIGQVSDLSRRGTSTEEIRLSAQAAAAILFWAHEPAEALTSVMTDLQLLVGTDQQRRCGELLTLGAAAVANLVSEAKARADVEGQARAERDLDRLLEMARDTQPSPFERFLEGGREVADGLQWKAELSRATTGADPELWRAAARNWEEQSRAHRAGYCWWRCAQAQVVQGDAPSSIAEALQRAHELSEEMQPLRAAVDQIALQAHIPLTSKPVAAQGATPMDIPVALTARELEVLRHLAAGRSNAQIGNDLFISPKTASVHVSNLLRKIGVTNRMQAAAWAEQVGVVNGHSGSPS